MQPQEDVSTRRAKARVGSVLRDKWRIERLLGIGGMAAVYAGAHRNGKSGAIKILHLELSLDPDARSRFLQEGYAANRVGHPGAVSVLDDDVAEDGSVFLVMELLEGRSVDALAGERPGHRLHPAEALNIVDQLLDVLAAAHDKGIVHRDLKPENLFLAPGGVVKVLDFGLARIREIQSPTHATQAGSPMGTPAFMPPEQALGSWDQVDARSDLWAAGATLFTLLTGRQVHEAPTLNQLMLLAMTKPAPPIGTILPDLPAPIAALVDRALAFRPDARWQSAREMQRALRDVGRTLPGFTDAPGAAVRSSAPPVDLASSGISGSDSPSLSGATLLRGAPPRRSRAARLGVAIGGTAALAVAVIAAIVALRAGPGPAGSAAMPDVRTAPPVASSAPPTVTPALAVPMQAAATAVPSGTALPSDTVSVQTAAAPQPGAKTPPGGSAKGPKKPAAPAKSGDPFLTWE